MPVKDEVDVCGGIRLGVLLSPMRVRSFNPAIIVYFWIPTRYGWNRPLRIEWGLYRLTYAEDGLAKGLGELGRSYRYFYLLNAHVTKVSDTEISGYFMIQPVVYGAVWMLRKCILSFNSISQSRH